MSDNYGRGSGPQDGGQQPPYQQPQQPPYQQPQQPPPYQQPYPQQPYQQQPYQQPPYQQPPPPPVQTTTVATTGGGGSPIVPIIIAIVVIAALAVGGYFLLSNKSNNNVANNATPTTVASNNGGNNNSANTPTGSGNSNANTPTDSGNSNANTPTGNNAVNTPSSGGNNNNNGGSIAGGLMVQANGKAADMLLPKQTLGYLSFNAKPGGDQQANLQRISDAFTSQAGWNQLSQQLGGLSGSATQGTTQQCAGQTTGTNKNGFITNATDVLQGNVLVALLTPDVTKLQQLGQSGANSSCAALDFLNQGFVVIADTSASQGTLLGKLKDASGTATKVDSYNGQDITKFDNNGSTYFLTMYGGTAVLAANEDNIKKVVDAGAGSDSLGADQHYQGAASHLPANRLGSLYINVTEVVALAQAAMSQSSSTPISGTTQIMSAMANIKGVAMFSFTAQPNGLQVDVSTNLDLGSMAGSYASPILDPRTFLDKIPADAWMVIGSQDLPGIYNGLVDQLNKAGGLTSTASTSTTQTLDQFKQQVNALTGMDFDKDLLPLLNGEMALFVSPDASGGMLPVGGVLVVKTSDATKAATLAQNLATRLGAMSGASGSVNPVMGQASAGLGSDSTISGTSVMSGSSAISGSAVMSGSTAPATGGTGAAPQEQVINGGKFYAVTVSGAQVYIGTINDVLFVSYGKSAIDNWGKSGGVSSSDVFKHSTDTTEKPNSGLIYFNLKAIATFAEQMAPSLGITTQQIAQFKPLYAPFEGMAITSTQYDKNSSHVVIFFDIQKP